MISVLKADGCVIDHLRNCFRALDRETTSEFTFYVVATDDGRETVRTSSAKVTIIVDDANDHTPGKEILVSGMSELGLTIT